MKLILLNLICVWFWEYSMVFVAKSVLPNVFSLDQ